MGTFIGIIGILALTGAAFSGVGKFLDALFAGWVGKSKIKAIIVVAGFYFAIYLLFKICM